MKKLNKKTVINEQHDPLSWLMQGAEDKKNNTEDMAPAKTVDSTISSNVTDAIRDHRSPESVSCYAARLGKAGAQTRQNQR